MASKNHGSPPDPSYTTLDNISSRLDRRGDRIKSYGSEVIAGPYRPTHPIDQFIINIQYT